MGGPCGLLRWRLVMHEVLWGGMPRGWLTINGWERMEMVDGRVGEAVRT